MKSLTLLAVLTGTAVLLRAEQPSAPQALFPGFEEQALGVASTSVKHVAVEGQPFANALHVTVDAPTEHPWNLQVVGPSSVPVEAGDTLAVAFAIRAVSGNGLVVVKLQDAGNQALLRQNVAADTTWRKAVFPLVASSNYAAGGLRLAFFLGLQKQEIEMGGVTVLDFGKAIKPEQIALPALAALPAVSRAVPPARPAATEAAVPAGPFTLPTLPPLTSIAPRYVMLKLDDLKGLPAGVHPRFVRVADYLARSHLNLSFGIIVNSFDTAGDAAFAWIKAHAVENGGLIEFWNHGWDHAMKMQVDGVDCTAEFSGPSYAYQAEHMQKACKRMQEKTGLTFHSFGSAGNATDATGARVLEEQPDIKVWLYGDPKAKTTKFVLRRTLNLEDRVGHVSFDAFMKSYAGQRNIEYVLLQGHPGAWSDESFVEFQHVVALLVADKWTFTTPYAFYQLKTGGAKP